MNKFQNISSFTYQKRLLHAFLLLVFISRSIARSISPYPVRMRENADKKKLRIWTLHTVAIFYQKVHLMKISSSYYARKNVSSQRISLFLNFGGKLNLGLVFLMYVLQGLVEITQGLVGET